MQESNVGIESMSAETIGQHFALLAQTATHSLEDRLYSVSNGEYEYRRQYDDKFKFWGKLFKYCHDWAHEFRAAPYRPFQTEADCMNRGMNRLMKNEGVRCPPPWMATIRKLRELARADSDFSTRVSENGHFLGR
jgi:hypothetical protein